MGIRAIHFHNFRALSDFQLELRHFNVLTGPNNCGKSTILNGLRLVSGAWKYAARRPLGMIGLPDRSTAWGCRIPEDRFPIPIENLRTDYNEDETSIGLLFDSGDALWLRFFVDGLPALVCECGQRPRTPGAFRTSFPFRVLHVPTLGPVTDDERILNSQYVRTWSASHRAPGMFRNIWYHDGEGFERLQALVRETWPGMLVQPPERADTLSDRLVMFCREDGIDRELFWVGFGFQIWLQLLTQFVRADEAELLVVDEPEIYLHPDLQRRIPAILRNRAPSTVLATHSVELINEVEPEDVLLVDKRSRQARRIADVPDLQRVAQLMGAGQNIQLARVARSRRVLFLEAASQSLLRRFATLAGHGHVFASGDVLAIPIPNIDRHPELVTGGLALGEVLGAPLKVAVILGLRGGVDVDSGPTLASSVDLLCILERAEAENYLLEPGPLQQAADARHREAGGNGGAPQMEGILADVVAGMRDEVRGEWMRVAHERLRRNGQPTPGEIEEMERQFSQIWDRPSTRLALVSGRTALARVNARIWSGWGWSLTAPHIVRNMTVSDLAPDLRATLAQLAEFASG